MMVSFEPTVIRVEKEQEFGELKGAINRALAPDRVEKFLKRVRRSGARIRDLEVILARGVFEKVEKFLKRVRRKGARVRDLEIILAKGVFEKVDDTLAKPGAQKLYQALTVSDQAQIREFYLSRVEEVEPAMRTKFQQLYRYY